MRIKWFCDQMELGGGQEVNAVHTFSDLTLAIVIDCIFGGERYLDLEALSPLWEKVNSVMNNYATCEILFGAQVS